MSRINIILADRRLAIEKEYASKAEKLELKNGELKGQAVKNAAISEGNGTDIQEPVINRKSCLRLADSSSYFNILWL